MNIELYDSYTKSVREFSPLQGNTVRMYACGPTVYDYAHIGNLRTYIFEDLLRRTICYYGYDITHVMNITDVGHLTSDADTGEDKIEAGSRRTGKTAWEIAEIYTQAFKQDIKALNIHEPEIWCKATDHIDEQIRDIKVIEEKGFAYITRDGVYFDTSKQAGYGYLARLDIEGLNAGQRVDLGEKRNATDFALWKFSAPEQKRQMEWESPWGRGFPGWHIECSAMATKYLGEMFDIHCGGKDHIPVHHSNEIAQCEVCYGTQMANFWLHGYFLEIDKEKMSKSSGEFLRLQTLIDAKIDPLSYRYLCLTANYRSDLKFTWESLQSCQTALNRLRNHLHNWGGAGDVDGESGASDAKAGDVDAATMEKFLRVVYQDLNAPKGLAVLWDAVRSNLSDASKCATILEMDKILGLDLERWMPAEIEIPDEVMNLLTLRGVARSNKDWAQADRIRDELGDLGYEVEDSPDGAIVRLK